MGTKDEPKAIEYLQKSLSLAEKEKKENLMAQGLINLSIAYDNVDTSLMLLNKAKVLAIKNSNFRALTFIFEMQAYFNYYEDNIDAAILASKNGLGMAKK